MLRTIAIALFGLGAACYSPREAFHCASAEQCQAQGRAGLCEANGFCSYADADCDSGWRYGSAAGDGLGDWCVGDEPASADAAPFVLPDAQVITGCTTRDDCAPLDDTCGTGACNERTGICDKVPENEGNTCDDPMCGDFDGCGAFDSTCDTSGFESRPCQPMVCVGGACTTGDGFDDERSCSRNTDGYKECVDSDQFVTCSGGSFGGAQSCASMYPGTICRSGFCVGCSAGEKACVDSDQYVECNGGSWTAPISCSASFPGTTCSNGFCVGG
jgi:hypothetical protein